MTIESTSCSGLGLRALLYCVFEQEEGPKVFCADPPNAVGQQFKPLGRFLLPETFVKGRVVSMVLSDNVLLGSPVYIEDTYYDRNCFHFNICMVISTQIDKEPHRELAQHLATAFHALEVELKLLSRPEEADHVRSILASLRSQLNASGECFVRVTDSHCISFRVCCLSPALISPAPCLSQVPVPLVDLVRMLGLQQRPANGAPFEDSGGKPGAAPELEDQVNSLRWGQELALPYAPDPTLLHLVPFIDGIRPVQDIIDACALDEDSVQTCLRHLLHFGLIAVIDAIELESRYALTQEFHEAFDRLEVRADAVRYATAGRSSTELVEIIQGLYAGMNGYDETLGEFKQAHAAELNKHSISLRHFVTFGLLRGFLERVDQVLNQAEAKELQTLRSTTVRRKQELKEQGMTPERINKDPGIKALVTRMNALKTKER